MKRIVRLVGLIAVALAVGYAAVQIGCRPSLSKLKSEADSLGGVYGENTATYAADTLATNVVLTADSAKPTTRAAVVKERASAGKVIRTAERQKENYRKQIKALTPRLQVFAELNYAAPLGGVLLDGTVAARAGVALRIKQDFDAQAFVQKPLLGDGQITLNIGLRKNWRLL